MCYSAQIRADHRTFVRLFYERHEGTAVKIPKATEAAFADPQGEDERRIKDLIDAWHA